MDQMQDKQIRQNVEQKPGNIKRSEQICSGHQNGETVNRMLPSGMKLSSKGNLVAHSFKQILIVSRHRSCPHYGVWLKCISPYCLSHVEIIISYSQLWWGNFWNEKKTKKTLTNLIDLCGIDPFWIISRFVAQIPAPPHSEIERKADFNYFFMLKVKVIGSLAFTCNQWFCFLSIAGAYPVYF